VGRGEGARHRALLALAQEEPARRRGPAKQDARRSEAVEERGAAVEERGAPVEKRGVAVEKRGAS
jgi:hypothetical protein